MSDGPPPKRVRKGTQSCIECRRRKVKCTWTNQDAKVCRRCEERGTECIAQTISSGSRGRQKLTSRDRISHLELKVAALTDSIRIAEKKLGYHHTDLPDTPPGQLESILGAEDDSDDESNVSDTLPGDRPHHLNAIFQNDWISSDTTAEPAVQPHKRGRSESQLLDVARRVLQPLLPSIGDMRIIAEYASRWLSLLNDLFPSSTQVQTTTDVLSDHPRMQSQQVDVYSLAQYLLIVALTAQQVPFDADSPVPQYSSIKSPIAFTASVLSAVETTIFAHDSLLGTVQGLSTAMLQLRLSMTRGNFQKSWLRLRHVIAIAEMIGLPRAANDLHVGKVPPGVENDPQTVKARLWESICGIDRVAGLIYNLPVGTKRYIWKPQQSAVVVDGKVQLPTYLRVLTDYSARLQDLDDLSARPGSDSELYAAVLQLDGDLRTLASVPPREWWNLSDSLAGSVDVLQFWHHYTAMRIHLPFALKQDPREEYVYSRLAGMDSCLEVLRRYLKLRQGLPSGFFVCRIFDFQAFTASVVLLLATHGSQLMNRSHVQGSAADISARISAVVELMEEKATDNVGSDFAVRGSSAIKALKALLIDDVDKPGQAQDLSIKVPLLGRIHVQRNPRPVAATTNATSQPSASAPAPSLWPPYRNTPQQPVTTSTIMGLMAANDWNTDPFSWTIQNTYDDYFQDSSIGESSDTFSFWPPDQNTLL